MGRHRADPELAELTPLHVVGGPLGVGKTTALLREVGRRGERCAILVNDFGEARIDATILGGTVAVRDIAGGCVCCTAPEGLAPALETILDEVRPDRIFVEPSGLARPRDLVDMIARSPVGRRLDRRPLVVMLDPAHLEGDVVDDALEGADVVVANRCDLASAAELDRFRERVGTLWPEPVLVAVTERGELPEGCWTWPEGVGPRASGGTGGHPHEHGTFEAASRIWPPDIVFSWDALRKIAASCGAARLKGLFRTDVGWYRLDVAGGHVHPAATGYRRDSRVDVITTGACPATDVVGQIDAARATPTGTEGEARVELVRADLRVPLPRAVLAAMPGQVPDVAALVPGRNGAGVMLAELLKVARACPGDDVVLVASDGMTSAPTRVADIGAAVLLHSLDGGPVPADQGGPFRVLAPKGQSACASVKGVVRVVVSARQE